MTGLELCQGCVACDFAEALRAETSAAFFHHVGPAAQGSFEVEVPYGLTGTRTLVVTVTEKA